MLRPPSKHGSLAGTKVIGFSPSDSIDSYTAHTAVSLGNDVADYEVKLLKKQDASSNYSTSFFEQMEYPTLLSTSEHIATGARSYGTSLLRHSNVFSQVTTIPDHAATDDLAIKRLKQKLASQQDYFKAMVPLGEIQETRHLIRTTADITSDLMKSLIMLKKQWRNPRYQKHMIKLASDMWLQYSFAIAPTVGEIDALLKSISSKLLEREHTTTVKASSRRQWVDDTGVDGNTYNACAGHLFSASKLYRGHSLTYTYTAGVLFDLHNANDYSYDGVTEFNRHFGTTLGDIIPAAWELFPFSWVVDYFSTMGDFLEDTFTSSAGNTIYVSRSTLYEVSRFRHFKLVNAQPKLFRTVLANNGTVSDKTTLYRREKLGVLPHRSFRFHSMSEVGNNSINRLRNLTSVAVQLFHKP